MKLRALVATPVAISVATLALLAGCSSAGPDSAAPDSSGATAASVLADHDLDASDPVALIDEMDRMALDERPTDLVVSVRADEVLVSSGDVEEAPLAIPGDKFYVSLAPWVDQTHECYYHSLTTCKGELGGEDVDVEITTADGETLVDETVTTFDNGFVGFWLPKDVEGTIAVSYDGKQGQVDFATDAESPTCLTTVQLA